MTTLDLQDAHFHVPIHQKHRKYLRFQVAGQHFQFKVLPFGLKSAPQIFTKCLAPVAAYLRQEGFQVFLYLDDWLVKAPSSREASRATRACLTLFHRLGLTLNLRKSLLHPRTEIVFLGAELHTIQDKAYPMSERHQRLKMLA